MSTELEAKLDQAKKDIKLAVEVAGKEIAALEKQIADEAKPKLDYDKPIMAVTGDGTLVMLVANCNIRSYDIKGYDWLRIKDGSFNSCRLWKTKEEAVKAYSYQKPFNGDLDDLKAMQETVTEFEIGCVMGNHQKFTACLSGQTNRVTLRTHNGVDIYVEEKDFSSLVLKLRQMQATLKRNK